MANTLLTVNEIAKESVMRLENNLVFANLVHRDYENEFSNKGETVNVRKPATFVANDFSTEITVQDIVESDVPVKLDSIADVSVEVTSKQLSLNIEDFGEQVVEGAMQALAQKIDSKLAGLYLDIPYKYGTAGTTPDALDDIAGIGKVLNTNKVPFSNRNLVIDPEAQAKFIILDSIVNAEKSGSTQALRDANLGRVLGFNTYLDQNIKTHTKGTLAATSGALAIASADEGATQVAIDATACAGTLKKGDIITIADIAGSYVVTADATAASNSITAKIYPALPTAVSNKAVTITASHIASVGFHKNAFALVTRPQALPMGGANGYIANYKGLPVRVTMGYSMSNKVNTISFDILYGIKTLTPELACRLLG